MPVILVLSIVEKTLERTQRKYQIQLQSIIDLQKTPDRAQMAGLKVATVMKKTEMLISTIDDQTFSTAEQRIPSAFRIKLQNTQDWSIT
jgi:hypothetical protein